MMKRIQEETKVWPVLVRSALALDTFASNSSCRVTNNLGSLPDEAQRNPSIETAATTTNFSSSTKRHSVASSRQSPQFLNSFNSIDRPPWCNIRCSSTISDIFCVTGGIVVIIGSLVASFGIFPRNQARIRLFLECSGCFMVITGVLVLFLSVKLRSSTTKENFHSTLRSELQNLTCFGHQLQPKYSGNDNGDRNYHSNESPSHLESNVGFLQSSRAIPSLLSNRNMGWRSRVEDSPHLPEVGRDSYPICALENNRPSFKRTFGVSPFKSSMKSSNKNNNADNEINDNSYRVNFIEKQELKDDYTIKALEFSDWTPNLNNSEADDEVPQHQAAIEAALSIVLTVSTMAGFRPEAGKLISQGGYECCCLHHLIQHTMSARKWINRLKTRQNEHSAATSFHEVFVPTN